MYITVSIKDTHSTQIDDIAAQIKASGAWSFNINKGAIECNATTSQYSKIEAIEGVNKVREFYSSTVLR